jgi:hypothetical protein
VSRGSPKAKGAGISTGSKGASRGSHSCSFAIAATAQSIRGSRTNMSSPSLYKALSVPLSGNSLIGSSAHCGS